MSKFMHVSKEEFIGVEHHFLEEPDMRISVNKYVEPSCITVTLRDEVIARAHLPKTPSLRKKKEPEYMVRSDILDKYLLTKYLP